MPRGQKIGDAYVRVYADGSNLSEGLVDDLNRAGEDGGRSFAKGWEKGIEDDFDTDAFSRKFDKMLGRMTGRLDRLDEVFPDIASKIFATIEDPEVARRVVERVRGNLERGFEGLETGGVLASIASAMEQVQRDVFRENRQLLADQHSEALRMNREFDRMLQSDRDRAFDAELRRHADRLALIDEAYEMNRQFDAKLRRDRDKDFDLELARQNRIREIDEERLRASVQNVSTINTLFGDTTAMLERLTKGTKRWGDSLVSVRTSLRDVRGRLREVDDDDTFEGLAAHLRSVEATLLRTTPRVAAFERRWHGVGDTIGRLSGRGSRNNFLNFIGSVNRGLFNLSGTVLGAFPRMIGLFGNMIKQFKELGGFSEGLSAGFKNLAASSSGITSLLSSGLPGLAVLGVAITALVASVGVLAAGLSGLLAILTALVATMGFALLGAVTALAGAFVVLGGAIGIAVAGFMSLDEEGKKALKNTLQPLTDAFKELGDAAGDELFRDMGKQVKQLTPVIEALEPTVRKTARAMRGVFDEFAASVDKATIGEEGGLGRFLRILEYSLPKAAESLGTSFGNALGGLGGVFTAIAQPGGILDRFLGWIEEITEAFNEWANSDEGQKKLTTFFEDVSESAKVFGDFIKQVTVLFGELFAQTREGGDTLFAQLTTAISDLIEWMTSPEGQEAIDKWIAFGVLMAESLGRVVLKAIELWDELDNEGNRTAVISFLTTVEWILGALVELAKLWDDGLGLVFGTLGLITGLITNMPRIKDITSGVISGLTDVLAKLTLSADKILRMPQVRNVFSAVQNALSSFNEALERVKQRIQNLPVVGDLFAGVISRIQSFIGMIERAIDALGRLARAMPGAGRLPGGVSATPSHTPGVTQSAPSGGQAPTVSPRAFGRTVVVPSVTINTAATDPTAIAAEFTNIVTGSGY